MNRLKFQLIIQIFMKLLIITSITDDKQEVSKLLQQSGIAIFSTTDTTGHKLKNGAPSPFNSWFGNKNVEVDSLMFFSFTDDDTAEDAVKQINQRNESHKSQFPIHAFVMAVESSSL